MSEKFESLGEQTQRINIALKHTDGDMEKAREMASGKYYDIKVVKGKFLAENSNQSGLFLTFFNIIQEYIPSSESVLTGETTLYNRVRIFDDWKSLFKDMKKYREEPDVIPDSDLGYFLVESMISHDVFPDVLEGRLENLTGSMQRILQEHYETKKLQLTLEMEDSSSLEMELLDVPMEDMTTGENEAEEEDPESMKEDTPEVSQEDEVISRIEDEANYIVEGKSIVSPVKGRFLSDIAVGEKMKVLLNGSDGVSKKILNVLNAYSEEGQVLPIKGRVKEKIAYNQGGYIFYVLVAKGILAKLVEEENVKILMDSPVIEEQDMEEQGSPAFILLGALLFVLIVTGVVLLLIF